MEEAKFQMDCYGRFRLVVNGQEGEHALYDSIAVVEVDRILYIGVTDYYDGEIEAQRVYRLTPVRTVVEEAPVCDLSNPEEPCIHEAVKEPGRFPIVKEIPEEDEKDTP